MNYSLLEVTDSQGFRVPRPWRCVFLEVLVSPCASRTAELAGELADVTQVRVQTDENGDRTLESDRDPTDGGFPLHVRCSTKI